MGVVIDKFIAGWYVIYTKPRHEKSVFSKLNELKIDSFLPMMKRLRNWNDRKKYIDMPLFPSYLFVYLNNVKDYYMGLGTEGVLYFVRTGKVIARIADSVINNIKLIINQGDEVEITSSRFQAGQQLFIQDGPLTGLSCEVVDYNEKKKILVRVQLIQRNILVSLPSEYLLDLPTHVS